MTLFPDVPEENKRVFCNVTCKLIGITEESKSQIDAT